MKFTQYEKPACEDICVAMCFFNPVGYSKTTQNVNIITQELKKSNIPYYIIELLYPNQTSNVEAHHTVYSNSVLFAKENLWNLLEKRIPGKYTKIIFMDCDVIFDDPKWIDKSSELLDQYDVIQCMEFTTKNILQDNFINDYEIVEDVEIKKRSAACGIVINKLVDKNSSVRWGKFSPGFCIGITRSLFHRMNGFYEYSINGGGDIVFWSTILNTYNNEQPYLLINKYPYLTQVYSEYKSNILTFKDDIKISYIENCNLYHFKHGSNVNRSYTDRLKFVPDDIEFFKNDNGVLEIKSSKSLVDYWLHRKEDE